MTDLSPAAQAVLNAAMEFSGPAFEPLVRKMVVAALRAAADQVVPYPAMDFIEGVVRDEILVIAAELEDG